MNMTSLNNENVMNVGTCGSKGRYRAVLEDERGNIKQDTGWQDNLLTDKGVYALAVGGRPFANGWLGTDNTPPTYADTQLGARVGSYKYYAEVTSVNMGLPDYEQKSTIKFTYPPGDATGTWAEFGTTEWSDYQTDVGKLCMRVVFPVPIIKNALDQLTIYYEWNFFVQLTDTVGVINIEAVPYDYTARCILPNTMSWYPSGGWTFTTASGHYHNEVCDRQGVAYPASLVGITSPIQAIKGVYDWCSSLSTVSVTGNGTIGYTWTVEFVWSIDKANNVGSANGIRALLCKTNWCQYNNPGGIQFHIARQSDGATHAKVDTHELRLRASITTIRIP